MDMIRSTILRFDARIIKFAVGNTHCSVVVSSTYSLVIEHVLGAFIAFFVVIKAPHVLNKKAQARRFIMEPQMLVPQFTHVLRRELVSAFTITAEVLLISQLCVPLLDIVNR
jgi:hypothetical protein